MGGQGQPQKALADLDQAIRLQPVFIQAHFSRALADAEQALKHKPTLPPALALRGQIRFLEGSFAQAVADLQAAGPGVRQDKASCLVWLYVARERAGQPRRGWLAKQAVGLDLSPWPGVIIDPFLGKATPQDVNGQAVKSTRVWEEALHQQNQAYFFLSQHYLLRDIPGDARINLEHCVRRNMRGSFEYVAAKAELNRLGPKPEKAPRKGRAKQE